MEFTSVSFHLAKAETSSPVWLFGISGSGVGLGDGSGASSAATEWKVTSGSSTFQ